MDSQKLLLVGTSFDSSVEPTAYLGTDLDALFLAAFRDRDVEGFYDDLSDALAPQLDDGTQLALCTLARAGDASAARRLLEARADWEYEGYTLLTPTAVQTAQHVV